MNAAQVHLMTAHLPVVGVPFAAVLLVVGLIGKSRTLWITGCWSLIVTATLAAFPYFSGPYAYDFVGKRSGVDVSMIESHAVVARGASLGLIVLGTLTVSVLLREWQGDTAGGVTQIVVLAGALLISYALAWSAHLGGLIRHPELNEPALRIFPLLG